MTQLNINKSNVLHRNTKLVNMLNDTRLFCEADGYDRAIGQIPDGTWWIVPDNIDDEDECPDIGPYDSPDDALVFFLLLFGDKCD